MPLINLKKFPILETISKYFYSKPFAASILGLIIDFLVLLSPVDHRHDHSISTKNECLNSESSAATKQEKKKNIDDDRSVCGAGDVEMFLRSLGLFCSSDGEEDNSNNIIPVRLDADDILNIFEEKNVSLDEVKDAFDVFDENRDGFIEAEELQKVLCALGLKEGLEMEKCRRMIGVHDENGDGKIDFDEFVKFMENSFLV